MSTPVNLSVTPSLRSTSLAHRRVTSFVRRGKRERIEGLFRSRWGRKVVKAKETAQKTTQLSGSDNALNIFLNPNTSPNPGELYLYWDSGSVGSAAQSIPISTTF